MRNWRKEALYIAPLLVALLVMVLYPTFTGGAISTIIGGFTGIIVIWKQEVPSATMTIRGKPAVVLGSLWILLTWGGTVLAIVAKLSNW